MDLALSLDSLYLSEKAFMTLFCMVSMLLSPGIKPVTLFIRPLLVGMPGPRERVEPVESEGGQGGRSTGIVAS